MLLHDSFFFSSNQSINETHYTTTIKTHSPLFNSVLTLILSIFGACSNFLSIIYLSFIISKSKQQKLLANTIEQEKSFHILSHRKYTFFIILTSNDFLLCLTSIISCIDQKYYSQSLIADYHLCSFHILLWKFTLHFIPLLIIFILCRYHYILYKKFPTKYLNTTTFNQLFYTDLCILIPFVIALAWSVDGLWLWGETNIKNFVTTTIIDNETKSTSTINKNSNQANMNLDKTFHQNIFLPEPKLICYLQTNDDIDFTTRLLHLIEADFLLLFLLHFIGFILEILLHIRLCCCLIAREITIFYLREQQISLYILYIFMSLTLTSIPFYFYRTIEIVFDYQILIERYDIINSRILAQIILFGISFKPILYLLLLLPTKYLFKFKCYTTIQIDQFDEDLLINSLNQQKARAQYDRFSLSVPLSNSNIRINLRTFSSPILSSINNQHENISRNTQL